MNPTPGAGAGAHPSPRPGNGGTMLRVFGAAQKREVKATKNLSIIVFFFIICWIPLYTINCIQAFCPSCHVSLTLTNCCIILSHLNSAGNPLLYAYHLRDFRAALKHLLYGLLGIKEDIPEYHGPRASLGSHIHHAAYNSRNNSVLSLRDAVHTKASSVKQYADFKVANSCIPPLPPEASPRMWTVPEVSSCDEESGRLASARAPIRLLSLTGRLQLYSDGKVNTAYIDDGMDFELGDDDVFVESTNLESMIPSTTTTTMTDVLDELPFRHYSSSSLWDETSADKCSPLTRQLRGSRSSSVGSTADHNSLLIVEAEVNNDQVDIDDRTELSITKRCKTPVINGKNDLNKFNLSSSEVSDSEPNRPPKDSPLKQLTRSPLKFVGELLFNNNNKSNFKKDLSEAELDKSTRNGSVVIESTTQPTDNNLTRVT